MRAEPGHRQSDHIAADQVCCQRAQGQIAVERVEPDTQAPASPGAECRSDSDRKQGIHHRHVSLIMQGGGQQPTGPLGCGRHHQPDFRRFKEECHLMYCRAYTRALFPLVWAMGQQPFPVSTQRGWTCRRTAGCFHSARPLPRHYGYPACIADEIGSPSILHVGVTSTRQLSMRCPQFRTHQRLDSDVNLSNVVFD